MASERRVAMLTRHLTSATTVSREQVQDFKAEGVYLFLTRDNVELRAKMLDHLKVQHGTLHYHVSSRCSWPGMVSLLPLWVQLDTWLLVPPLQDDIYRQNYYLSLMEFRELTMQRLRKFVDQRFFSVFDYLEGVLRFAGAL